MVDIIIEAWKATKSIWVVTVMIILYIFAEIVGWCIVQWDDFSDWRGRIKAKKELQR